MRVDPVASLLHAMAARKAATAPPGAPLFDPDGGGPAATAAPAAAAPTSSVAMLVAMSAVTPAPTREKAERRAGRGIDGLSRLHRALVTEDDPVAAERDLKAWLAEPHDDDPALAPLHRDIALRILVELAKRER